MEAQDEANPFPQRVHPVSVVKLSDVGRKWFRQNIGWDIGELYDKLNMNSF